MDTIYSLFQQVAMEQENAPAILENNRTMTFGELSDLVDRSRAVFPGRSTASASSCATGPR